MVRSVSGEYSIAVDSNRVRIPAKYREYLGDNFAATPGTDGCFFLMPYEVKDTSFAAYTKLADPIRATLKQKNMVREFNYLTRDIVLDAQGRMLITDELTDTCTALKRPFDTLVFCGMGEYIEVWTQHAYNKVFGNKITSDDFDALIASLQSQLDD